MRLAILEDDPNQADVIREWLEGDGHSCTLLSRGRDFYRALQRDSFDVLVIDWLVPDLNGLNTLRRYRETISERTPILLISVKSDESDVVTAIDAGADDYLVKPLRREEFKARVRALHRRRKVCDISPYRLEPDAQRVYVREVPVRLTDLEFRLAQFLFDHVDEIVSRSHMLEAVWHGRASRTSRSVDSYVSRIRNKLGFREPGAWRLDSVFQRGYRLSRIDGGPRRT